MNSSYDEDNRKTEGIVRDDVTFWTKIHFGLSIYSLYVVEGWSLG